MTQDRRRTLKFVALFVWFAATTAVVAWTWHDTAHLQNEINTVGKNSSAYRCYYSSRGAAVTWLSNAQERDALIGTAIAVLIILWMLHCCVLRKMCEAAPLKIYIAVLGAALLIAGCVIAVAATNYLHKTKNIKRSCDLPVRVLGLGFASFGMLLVLIAAIAYFCAGTEADEKKDEITANLISSEE